MSRHDITKDRLHIIGKQTITLEPIDCSGLVLDIGGGGEGVIGLLHSDVVIAIDNRKSELIEAPSGPVKAVMDATDLHFLNETFDTAVAFFSLMYVPSDNRESVFRECHRVLRPDGKFLIWDVTIRKRAGSDQDVFVVPLEIRLPHTTVETSYGVPWEDRRQDMDYYINLAGRTGFDVIAKHKRRQTFYLELRKRI